MFHSFRRQSIRHIIGIIMIFLALIIFLQCSVELFFAYKSKDSSRKMASLIISGDTNNLSVLLSRADSLINLLETDSGYIFTPASTSENDIIADSKKFTSMRTKFDTLIKSCITDTTFNNSFLFLSDDLPLAYVAPDYNNRFNPTSHPNSIGIYSINSILNSEWLRGMQGNVDASIWVDSSSERNILCFVKNLVSKSVNRGEITSRPLGVFFISFDLSSLLNQLYLDEVYPQSSVTLSYNEKIIYSTDKAISSKPLNQITYTSSPYSGLTLTTNIPKNSVDKFFNIQVLLSIGILISLIIVWIILVLYVGSKIVYPIENMAKYLLKKEQIPLTYSKELIPEIDILYKSHNIMIDRVNEEMMKSRKKEFKRKYTRKF